MNISDIGRSSVLETEMSPRIIIIALFCVFAVSTLAEEQSSEKPEGDKMEEKHFGLSTTELTQLIEQENDVAALLLHHIENVDATSGNIRKPLLLAT